MSTRLSSIRRAIREGELQTAISHLMTFTETHSPRFHNEVILHAANLQQLRTNVRMSILNPSEERNERNRIIYSLLELMSDIEHELNRKNDSIKKDRNSSETSPAGEELEIKEKGGVSMISILFLAADPTDASRLRLGEELREIQEKLQLAKLRERFELHQRMSVRPADISQALLDVQPQIVHFSGHGMAAGALCFENKIGETHPIQPDALAALFEQFANQVNCVVLNACYSEIQANAIAKHINYVVGMNQAIGDEAAIAFAVGFYQALGAGHKINEAYNLGCVQIRLQSIPEHLTPVLIKE